jgi:hypothetical protein
MGLLLEFYAGPADAIGAAFTEGERSALRDGSLAHAYADLSLRVGPEALDILSEQAGILLDREPLLLLDCLERSLGGTEGENGADLVSRTWVEFVAAVPVSSAAELSRRWLEAFAAENDEELDVDSPDAAAAVAALIRLCNQALERRSDVVFGWSL